METQNSYLPVDPDFLDIISLVKEEQKSGKVHYFDSADQIMDSAGPIVEITSIGDGEFINLANGQLIRLDRIITLYGRPGPAYDRYDSFANACLACEDLGQFY